MHLHLIAIVTVLIVLLWDCIWAYSQILCFWNSMFRVGLNLYLCVYKCVTWKMFNDRVKPSKLNWGTCGSATQTLGGVHASVFLWACIASCSFILSYNVGPSVSCPLTVLVCKENFGVVCWYELQQQVFRICDNQWAAVLQYRSAQVRIYCWVHTASLRPEGRQEKKKKDWKCSHE